MLSMLLETAYSLVSFSVLMSVVCRFIVSVLLSDFGGVSVRTRAFVDIYVWRNVAAMLLVVSAQRPARCCQFWPAASAAQSLTCECTLRSADHVDAL